MVYKSESRRARVLAAACCGIAISGGAVCCSAQGQEELEPAIKPGVPASPLKFGPVDVFFRLNGSVYYDDNIFINRTNRHSDVIGTISPGITLGVGDYNVKAESFGLLHYTPSFIFFAENTKQNTIDHDARLEAQYHPGNLTVGLEQGFQSFSGPVVDVGNRVDRQLYNTALSFNYEISPKTSVELDGTQSINRYERFINFNEWTAAGWFDYELAPKVKIGAGVLGGFVDIQNSVNQTYQQGLLRASYVLSEKLTARASAGVELREFESSQKNKVNGVLSLGATYKPLENTELILDGHRRDTTSVVLTNQNYTLTGFNATLRQTFLVKYALSVGGGYDHASYHATTQPVVNAPSRRDDYYFARVGLDWKISERLVASVIYEYRRNDSSLSNFGFYNHQVGLNIAYQF